MSEAPRETSPMVLGDFHQDCRSLEEESFVQRHGEAFLLHHGPVGELREPRTDRKTVAAEVRGGTGDRLFDPKSDFVVFRLKSKESGLSESLIWVGRNEKNDVVVPDASISSVHAFFKRDKEGRFHIQVMSSTNGSFVNGAQVAAQGEGPTAELQNGAQVVLGSVRMSFLYAREFRSLVTRLIG